MTVEEIQTEIEFQKQVVATCNTELLRLITSKSTVNTSDSQTQLMVVERRIAEIRDQKKDAIAEIAALEASLSGGGMLQLRPFA